MTLFRQMALMLSTFLFFVLTIVLILNFQSTKKSVKDRLYDDAKNTASSLSLSLGNANGDIAAMSTMINANFDSGNYNKVSLVDVDGHTLYERKTESQQKSVPKWFLELIDVKAPVAFANVSAGWSQVGILEVVGDATYAHKQLYYIFINLVILFVSITIVGLLILNYLIHIMLKPLKDVQKQASALTRNEFIIQLNTPYISEFKDLVIGMNNMVIKVKAMFEKGNRELKALKENEYIDKDTGLKNKKYFIDKLPEYLKVDASKSGGVNILIFIDDVTHANDTIGRVNVNKLLNSLIFEFKKYTQHLAESMVIRMGGVEFSIFLPDCTDQEAVKIVKNIQDSSCDIFKNYKLDIKEICLYFGIYEYSYKNSIKEFLSACDDALLQAKISENKIYIEKTKSSDEIMSRDEWRESIIKAIENNNFEFVFWNVVDIKNKKVIHNVISVKMMYDGKKFFEYSQFMAHAIQNTLSYRIYEDLVNMIFTKDFLKEDIYYSFRLPKEYLEHKEAYIQLKNILNRYSRKKLNLTIELPDKLLREDSKLIRDFINLFRLYGIDIGIFEFIGEGDDYEYIQHLRPIYIKAQASYLLSQSKESLNALRLITDTVGISLIAVGVDNIEELHKLENLDIFNIQGGVTLSIN